MSKRPRQSSKEKSSGTWPVTLVAAAAAGHVDGGVELQSLLHEAGFTQKPAMSIIVKRPRPRMEKGRLLDPMVEDVLDALRAMCA